MHAARPRLCCRPGICASILSIGNYRRLTDRVVECLQNLHAAPIPRVDDDDGGRVEARERGHRAERRPLAANSSAFDERDAIGSLPVAHSCDCSIRFKSTSIMRRERPFGSVHRPRQGHSSPTFAGAQRSLWKQHLAPRRPSTSSTFKSAALTGAKRTHGRTGSNWQPRIMAVFPTQGARGRSTSAVIDADARDCPRERACRHTFQDRP